MNRKKIFLFLLIGTVSGLCFLMVSPYIGYLLTGGILAFMLLPLKERLEDYTSYSASIITALTVLVAVLPLLFAAGFVANDASNLIQSIETQNVSLDFFEQRIAEMTGQEVNLEQRLKSSIRSIGNATLSGISQIAGLASSFMVGLSLLLFIEYYLLKEGRKLEEWTEKLDLIPTDIQKDLYRKTADTTRSVVKGHIATAAASGLVAGIGMFIVGIPNVVFWTFVMMILGLIPLIGTTLVWAPAALFLLANGQIYSGAFLLVYGLAVVGSIDNLLRPFLVDESADLHPMFIILGVVGGVGLFGPIGVFVGPVAFGVAKSLLTIYIEHYEEFQ